MDDSDVFRINEEDNRDILIKNGKPAICPFQGPIQFMRPHPIDRNQMVLNVQSIPCNSDCVFFRKKGDEVYLTCTLRSINIKDEAKVCLTIEK